MTKRNFPELSDPSLRLRQLTSARHSSAELSYNMETTPVVLPVSNGEASTSTSASTSHLPIDPSNYVVMLDNCMYSLSYSLL